MLIEALAVIGLDPASEYALENLRKASEILRREYGVKLVVVPFNTWSDSLSASLRSLPIIFIGGVKAFSGYPPSVEEVVDFVIRYIEHNYKKTSEALIPAAILGNDPVSISAATV